jgi:D-alanyl-lipoteichoic acid acyltransferase DltB (MBOAT superfamily)
MFFNSFALICFLPVVLVVYYLSPHRGQNWSLLFASCFFYACWDWRFLAPLLLSTSIDYWCATRMEDQIEKGRPIEARKPYLVLSLVTNLGLLGFFKYFNFFTGSFQSLLGHFGVHPSLWTLRVILPVGISFYAFQALSYTIDVYRGQLHATRKFHEFLLAVLYFLHLVAGPIQRANNLTRKAKPEGTSAPAVVQMIQYTTKTRNFVKWSWFTPDVSALAYSILLYFVLFRGARPESFIYFQF